MKTPLWQGLTVCAAALAGWAVSLTGMPLGWMIGAMLITAFAALAQLPARAPARVFDLVRAAVGTMLGAAFTIDLLRSFPQWWGSLLALLLALTVMFVLAYVSLRRLAGFDRPSALLCAIPGGIAEMILLSDKAGADQARVAIAHALRISITILILPVLIWLLTGVLPVSSGAAAPLVPSSTDIFWFTLCVAVGFLARKWKAVPAPLVIVPMVLSGALHIGGVTAFEVPEVLANVVQVFIGINVGGRFAGVSARALLAVLGSALLVVGIQIFISFAAATGAAHALGLDLLTLTLAYAPGGLAEMSLIAVASDADVAVVGLHHVFRVLAALIAAPWLLKVVLKP